jgi:hypothetical protein
MTLTKTERNAAKAQARSRRNSAEHTRTTAQQRRTARRKAERTTPSVPTWTESELQTMTVPILRDLCEAQGIHASSKSRKPELIEKLLA